ncbi:MAG: hypothetical protein ACR2PH_09735, partial [Desulfobulbia bacterium]
ISFYSIYVNTWMEEGANTPKAYTDHDWELIWAKDDDSSRWGTTWLGSPNWPSSYVSSAPGYRLNICPV